MTYQYIVWLEVQKVKVDGSDYYMLDDPVAEIATFDSLDEANEFVSYADCVYRATSLRSHWFRNRSRPAGSRCSA
jgi:hypothetical protein